jgi:LysR family glycine cleavage system transcriptional activator
MPSLTALRAFEAAARHGSLTRAAQELFITQSAVSRQVQALERDLGMALFERSGRHIALTTDGQELADAAGRAFEIVRAAVARLRRRREAAGGADRVVTISMLPSLAAKWFTPRLGRLFAAMPDLDLRISASRALVAFDRDGVDCAIRYGRGDWPGTRATRLMDEEVFPAASPRLGIGTLEKLSRSVLLQGDIPDDWDRWFAAAGLRQPRVAKSGPRFTDDVSLIEAAVDGIGVALVRSTLVERELKEGRLVRIGDHAVPASFAYYFVVPDEDDVPDRVRAILTWLQQEVAGRAGAGHRAGSCAPVV